MKVVIAVVVTLVVLSAVGSAQAQAAKDNSKILQAVEARFNSSTLTMLKLRETGVDPKRQRLRLTVTAAAMMPDASIHMAYALVAQALSKQKYFALLKEVTVIYGGPKAFKAVTLSATDAEACGLGINSPEECKRLWKPER